MKFLEKVHYLRHPYLIWRTILQPLEDRDSKKHRLRLGEYDHYFTSLEEAIGRLFDMEITGVVRLRKQLEGSGFLGHIESC